MESATADSTAVVIAETISEDGIHKAGRAARLHANVPVFVLTSEGEGVTGAIFDRLQPFQRVLVVKRPRPRRTRVDAPGPGTGTSASGCGTRPSLAIRCRRPGAPGQTWTRFFQEDNILQLRSILTEVAACGRRWVPARAVQRGSFIELSDRDLETIARAEHARWYREAASRPPGRPAAAAARMMP